MSNVEYSEMIASGQALEYLLEGIGENIFIGSSIEHLLSEQANIIYQHIEDPKFFGATIINNTGAHEKFVYLNTYHSMRIRYFTAAHEMWHLTEGAKVQDSINHERAADHFAATLMLPSSLVSSLYQRFLKGTKKEDKQRAVIVLADLAATPYETVQRRLTELEYRHGLNHTEEEWVALRESLGFAKSPLDSPLPFNSFPYYEAQLRELVESGEMSALDASFKISKFNSELALEWQLQESQKTSAQELEDTTP